MSNTPGPNSHSPLWHPFTEGKAPLDTAHVKHLRITLRMMRNSLPLNGPGRYNSMVFTSLEKAAMWLGDVLFILGEAYPYVNGVTNPTDETDSKIEWPEHWQPTMKLASMRDDLGHICHQVIKWMAIYPADMPREKVAKYILALQAVYTHCREARLDLGMEYGIAARAEQVQQTK